MKPIFAIFLLLSFSIIANARTSYGTSLNEQETLSWAFHKAQTFSGITSLDPESNWKKISYFLLTDAELSAQVCPDDPNNCHGLAAVFDTVTKSIYIREDVNPDIDMINISFLIHELVHSLQNETRSDDEMFGTCQKLYATEKEAYQAQDAFLKSEGQFFRAGNALRFFNCTDK